jgi:hypothetical protein
MQTTIYLVSLQTGFGETAVQRSIVAFTQPAKAMQFCQENNFKFSQLESETRMEIAGVSVEVDKYSELWVKDLALIQGG